MPVFLFLLVLAGAAEGQVRWGARVGIADGEPMVGADVIMKIASSNFYFNPNVELSGYGLVHAADVHYDVEISRDAALWVGTGIALIIPDGEDLTAGVNLVAGIGTRRGRYIFYTQLKRTIPTGEGDFDTLAAGIRF